MNRAVLWAALLLALGVAMSPGPARGASWPGVDEAVVERYATAAGRPPRAPLIAPGEGDMLLFLFLVAGAVGGFVAGYYFRALFPPKGKPGGASR
jgi:cobalt/nickel transport system permease protein